MSHYGSFVLQCYVLRMRVMTSTVGGNLTNRPPALRHKHVNKCLIRHTGTAVSQSQRARGLRRGSAAARLLRLWVRFSPGACMSVCCECCVLLGRGSLRRADQSSRGVLPIVMRRCVWSRNLVNEEVLAHWGAVAPKERKKEKEERYCHNSEDMLQLCISQTKSKSLPKATFLLFWCSYALLK